MLCFQSEKGVENCIYILIIARLSQSRLPDKTEY